MRLLSYALLSVTILLREALCSEFSDLLLNSATVSGMIGSYLSFVLSIVDPSTSTNNSVVCQYSWYTPGLVNQTQVPTDSNVSWNDSSLNENYVRERWLDEQVCLLTVDRSRCHASYSLRQMNSSRISFLSSTSKASSASTTSPSKFITLSWTRRKPTFTHFSRMPLTILGWDLVQPSWMALQSIAIPSSSQRRLSLPPT